MNKMDMESARGRLLRMVVCWLIVAIFTMWLTGAFDELWVFGSPEALKKTLRTELHAKIKTKRQLLEQVRTLCVYRQHNVEWPRATLTAFLGGLLTMVFLMEEIKPSVLAALMFVWIPLVDHRRRYAQAHKFGGMMLESTQLLGQYDLYEQRNQHAKKLDLALQKTIKPTEPTETTEPTVSLLLAQPHSVDSDDSVEEQQDVATSEVVVVESVLDEVLNETDEPVLQVVSDVNEIQSQNNFQADFQALIASGLNQANNEIATH
jgi:hypothetical protein